MASSPFAPSNPQSTQSTSTPSKPKEPNQSFQSPFSKPLPQSTQSTSTTSAVSTPAPSATTSTQTQITQKRSSGGSSRAASYQELATQTSQVSTPQSSLPPAPVQTVQKVQTVTSATTTPKPETTPFGTVVNTQQSRVSTGYVAPTQGGIEIGQIERKAAQGDEVAQIQSRVLKGKATTVDIIELSKRGVSNEQISEVVRINEANKEAVATNTAIERFKQGKATDQDLTLVSNLYAKNQADSGLASIDPALAKNVLAQINIKNAQPKQQVPKFDVTNKIDVGSPLVGNIVTENGKQTIEPTTNVSFSPKDISAVSYTEKVFNKVLDLNQYPFLPERVKEIQRGGSEFVFRYILPVKGAIAIGAYGGQAIKDTYRDMKTGEAYKEGYKAPTPYAVVRDTFKQYPVDVIALGSVLTGQPETQLLSGVLKGTARFTLPYVEAITGGAFKATGAAVRAVGLPKLATPLIETSENIATKGVTSYLTKQVVTKLPVIPNFIRGADLAVTKAYEISPVAGIAVSTAREGVELAAKQVGVNVVTTAGERVASRRATREGITQKELDYLFYNKFIPAQQEAANKGSSFVNIGNYGFTAQGYIDQINFAAGTIVTGNAGGRAVQQELKNRGYTQEQAKNIYQYGIVPRIAGQTIRETAFSMNLNAATELVGRSAFGAIQGGRQVASGLTAREAQLYLARTTVPTLFTLGAIEGASTYAGQQALRGQQVGAGATGFSALFGAGTASILGGGIAAYSATKPTRAAQLETVGNIADPFEAVGDVRASINQATREAVGAKPTDNIFIRTRTGAKGETLYDIGTSKQFEGFTGTTPKVSVRTPANVFSYTETFEATPTQTYVPTVVPPDFTAQTIAATNVFVSTPTNVKVPVPTQVTVPSQITLPTPTQVNVPEETQVPENVNVPTPTDVMVPIPVSVFGRALPLPFIPSAGLGSGSSRGGKGGKVTYYDELAAGLTLFGFGGSRQASAPTDNLKQQNALIKQRTALIKQQQKEIARLQKGSSTRSRVSIRATPTQKLARGFLGL